MKSKFWVLSSWPKSFSHLTQNIIFAYDSNNKGVLSHFCASSPTHIYKLFFQSLKMRIHNTLFSQTFENLFWIFCFCFEINSEITSFSISSFHHFRLVYLLNSMSVRFMRGWSLESSILWSLKFLDWKSMQWLCRWDWQCNCEKKKEIFSPKTFW